jgi:hemolysin D
VQLLDAKLDSLPQGARLIPGMTLSAEIKVGTRSVLSYFVSPLTKGLSESIREP